MEFIMSMTLLGTPEVVLPKHVCIPILVTTFPEWLSGTEPLPLTPGAA